MHKKSAHSVRILLLFRAFALCAVCLRDARSVHSQFSTLIFIKVNAIKIHYMLKLLKDVPYTRHPKQAYYSYNANTSRTHARTHFSQYLKYVWRWTILFINNHHRHHYKCNLIFYYYIDEARVALAWAHHRIDVCVHSLYTYIHIYTYNARK